MRREYNIDAKASSGPPTDEEPAQRQSQRLRPVACPRFTKLQMPQGYASMREIRGTVRRMPCRRHIEGERSVPVKRRRWELRKGREVVFSWRCPTFWDGLKTPDVRRHSLAGHRRNEDTRGCPPSLVAPRRRCRAGGRGAYECLRRCGCVGRRVRQQRQVAVAQLCSS